MSNNAKTASGTSSSVNGHDLTINDLSDQIAILKSDIASLTGTLSEYGKAKTTQAAQTAKDAAADAVTEARVKALDAQAQAEDFIRTQPATALGIAAGVGFLVGMITSRR